MYSESQGKSAYDAGEGQEVPPIRYAEIVAERRGEVLDTDEFNGLEGLIEDLKDAKTEIADKVDHLHAAGEGTYVQGFHDRALIGLGNPENDPELELLKDFNPDELLTEGGRFLPMSEEVATALAQEAGQDTAEIYGDSQLYMAGVRPRVAAFFEQTDIGGAKSLVEQISASQDPKPTLTKSLNGLYALGYRDQALTRSNGAETGEQDAAER